MLTIGKLSSQTGVGVETLRFYEREGLILPSQRTASGYRQYQPYAVSQVQFIQKARKIGFSLPDIKEFLNIGMGQGSNADTTISKAEGAIVLLESRKSEIDEIISILSKLINNCRKMK